MKTLKKEQILKCSNFNQLLNAEYGERGTQSREQFEAEAEAFALGELLQQERKSAGMTQQQLAQQAGYNRRTISRIENGNKNVSLDSIFRIFSGMGRKVAISVLTLTLLLTLGVGQMWGTPTIYVVGSMQKNDNNWVEVSSTPLYCHNWEGGAETTWPGTAMTKTAYTAAGHAVFSCDLNTGNSNLIINNSWQTNTWSISATEKAYPQPTCINGTWVYSIKMADALWSGNQTVSGGYIYFDNTNAQWSDAKMYLVVGHSSYIGYYELTKLAGTNLYYTNQSNMGWDDAKFVAVAGNSTEKTTGGGNPNDLTTLTHYSDVIGYGLNTGTSYMISMSSGTNCTPISIAYQTTGYTAYNSRQTVYKVLGSSTTTTDVGTVTVTTTKLTNNCVGTKDNSTATIGTSASSAYTDAVKTATVTLTASAKTGYEFVGWATSASGSVVSDDETFTYTATAATSYYAKFREVAHTVTYTSSAGGSVTTPASSSSTVGQVTGVSIEATPSSGYHFDGWSVTSGTGSFANSANASTTFYPTANATIKATFAADAEETHDVTVSYKYGATSIKDNTTESAVGVETSRSVTAPAITGYTFSSWTLGDGLTNKSANTTTNPISIVTKASGSYTLTANYTLNSHNVTFNANGGSGSMGNESFNYNQTKALTTNTLTRTGYVFKGWATSAALATAGTVAYADGADYTMGDADVTLYAVWYKKVYFVNAGNWTAANVKAHVYTGETAYKTWNVSEEVMTSTGTTVFGYTIYSYEFPETYTTVIFHNNGNDQTSAQTWAAATPYYYSGHLYASTAAIREDWKIGGSWGSFTATTFSSYGESTATYTVELAASTSYTFKYYYTGTDTWHGCGGGTMNDGDTWTLNGDQNVTFTTTVAGTYTFTIDYSTLSSNSGHPSCTLTFPTSYTLTYSIGTIAGTAGTITASPSVASGSLVVSGTSITLTAPSAKTGYSWKGWYDNAAGTGEALHNQQAYTFTVDDNTTLYACYNETTYAVTLNNGDHGTVSPSGSTQIGATGVEVTATPAAGWKFNGWTKTGTYVTLSSETANPTTVKAAGTGSVTPTYIQRYILRGSLKDDSDNAGMAGWSATDNSAYASATIAGNVMTVTATLTKSKTDYKFKIFDLTSEAWRGQTSSDGYIPDATQWALNGGNDVCFRATAIGTYTFAVDFTTADAPAVTVTRPTGFPVNYGFGTIEGASSAPTAQTAASITVNSGDSVQSGTSVTLTAEAAKTGYTWQGWYTTPNTSGTRLSTELAYTTTVSAATTVYAVYTENLYTVTVTAGDNGSITIGSPSVQAGIDTNPTITATANTGYRFSYWEVVRGTATFANDHAATTTVSASSDATIRAVFGSNWVIGGSTATFGNWAMENGFSFANFEIVDGKELGYVNLELPANSEFEVKVYDHNTGGWYGHETTKETVTYTSNNGTPLLFELGNDKENLRIVTAGHGTYQFVWNQTDHKLTVNYPTSYTVTYGQKTYYGVDESSDATTTGGTFSVVDGDANALASGAYIVGTQAAVFTAVPATNYSLAGWYKDSEFTNAYVNGEAGAVITTNTLALTPTVNSNVYAKFAENMTTVAIAHNAHGQVKLGGTPVTSIQTGARTTRSITAVADAGYYFAGWTVTSGSDFTPSATGEANTTITVTGNGAGETMGQVLTANFVELDKVYFRNIFDDGENTPTSWENVYVYFDAYWDEGELGAGAKDRPYALMTQVGTSNVYVAYIPRSITAANKKAVAFSNVDFHDYNNFNGSKAVYRTDYSSILNMFVPYHTSSETKNTTEYFSNGYWMQYETVLNESAGYYLKKRTGTNTYEEKGYFAAMTDNATTIQYKLYINEEGTGNNKYRITSAGGLNYVAASQITSANYRDIELNENNTSDSYFEIMPTSEGYYTLQINQEGDKMKLTVIYPISVGDHRLKNTFTVDEETKYTYSDIIKSDVSEQKVSMYINNKTAASSLKLQRCTGLTDGVATWDDGTTVTMTGIKSDTMGVYVFDLAVSGDEGTISNAAPYKGSYYLKTDLAPGAWINYQQNAMQLNTNTFNKNKATTFDYYSCFWCGSAGTNIKCVVANEYCNQLSDTLFGDAVIGVGAQTMPAEGNIRFSYNSTTNEVKRSYINGSAYWEDQFLLLSGSPKMVDKDTRSTFTDNKTTFVDMNNWTYQKDVACYANANVILTAQFNGHTQLLLGSTNNTDSVQLIGGSGSTLYNMRLVYDFKTDYLISGLLAGNTNYEEDQAIYSDVIIIRGGQNNAQQLTFGTDKALTEVKTVYGVMQFEKSTITNSSLSRYLRNTYWVSFPFDVNLNDAVGFGTYGKHWIIQYYDGAARAANGAWIDSPNYWTYVMPSEREAGYTLKAHVGYLLSLSLSNMSNSSNIWDNGVTTVSLYFPSKEPVATINGELPEAGSFVVPAHPVTFAGSERDGRYYKDANWNVIGVPSYANIDKTVSGTTKIMEYDMPFLYTYDASTNKMDIASAGDVTFGAMKAYLVQYAGTINWRLTTIPADVAARRNADAPKDTYTLCLRLNQEGQTIDKTFISFNDEMTTGLDMNKDLTKAFNKDINNIYTICDDVELGAQFLPLGDETVYIPVGIDAAYNGTIELGMPNGTDGLEVYLFDRETQKHTNMLTSTYTVDLTQGINDDRFVLEVRRPQMPTDIMTTGSVEDETTKYMQNGHLYIKQGNQLYNAEGKRVSTEK